MSKDKNIKPFKYINIPSDWEMFELRQLGSFSKGKGILKDQLVSEGISCIRYGEIYTTYDYKTKELKSFISEEIASESKEIGKGDILFAGSGETIEEIGKSVAYVGDERAFAGGDIIILATSNNTDPECLSYALETDFARRQKRVLGQGNSVVHIYASDLAKLKIPLPDLLEQKSIALLLNTWGEAIMHTQQLIDKLKERNKGLAQQLLTGKRRLEKFKGEWKNVSIKDVFYEINETNDGSERHRVMTISSTKGLISQQDKFDRIIAGDSLKKYTLLKNGDFAYNKGNSKTYPTGCVYQLVDYKSALVPFVYICFSATKKIDARFYSHYFINHGLDHQLMKIITSGARGDGLLNVNNDDFFNLKIPFPSIEEQTAIAQFLQIADNEIKLLKLKHENLKEQKKGLMQILLTGKKRLKVNSIKQ